MRSILGIYQSVESCFMVGRDLQGSPFPQDKHSEDFRQITIVGSASALGIGYYIICALDVQTWLAMAYEPVKNGTDLPFILDLPFVWSHPVGIYFSFAKGWLLRSCKP